MHFFLEKKSFGGISFEFLYSMMGTFLKLQHLKTYFEELLACSLNINYVFKVEFSFFMNLGRE